MAGYAPVDVHIADVPLMASRGFSNVSYTLKPKKLSVEDLGEADRGKCKALRNSEIHTKTARAQKIETCSEVQRQINDANTPAEIRLWQSIERARLAVIDRCQDARIEEMKRTKILRNRIYKPASSRTSYLSKLNAPIEITKSPLKPRRAKSAYNKIIRSYS